MTATDYTTDPERKVINMSEALQIVLGEGRVSISIFQDSDGRGIILKDSGVPHEIGSSDGVEGDEHHPEPGEFYIKCTNKESALVLLERVQKVVDGFESHTLVGLENDK